MDDTKRSAILSDYLSQNGLAKQLGVHERTVWKWRTAGRGPPVTLIGQKPYYSIAGVRDWLRSREQKMPRERSRRTA